MPAAQATIEEILAAALQRRAASASAVALAGGEPYSELYAAAGSLRQELEQALGPRLGAVRLQLDKLSGLFAGQGIGTPQEVWTTLDELEDQLEALLRS